MDSDQAAQEKIQQANLNEQKVNAADAENAKRENVFNNNNDVFSDQFNKNQAGNFGSFGNQRGFGNDFF